MLKTRVIPTLLWKNMTLVKGKSFDSWRRVGTILPAVRVYNLRDVDELIVLDIEATAEKREPDYDEIKNFAADCFVPLTFGGGLHSIEHIATVLRCGADKVAINSAAYQTPELIQNASEEFGSQCIVGSVDYRINEAGQAICYSGSGRVCEHHTVIEWCQNLQHLGAGELLVTSIERDGTMSGYDLDMIRTLSASVTIPVIASGGAGVYEHMCDAVNAGASAVAAAAMFHFTEQTPAEAKIYLGKRGISVRSPA